jgi:hypothetical protein
VTFQSLFKFCLCRFIEIRRTVSKAYSRWKFRCLPIFYLLRFSWKSDEYDHNKRQKNDLDLCHKAIQYLLRFLPKSTLLPSDIMNAVQGMDDGPETGFLFQQLIRII